MEDGYDLDDGIVPVNDGDCTDGFSGEEIDDRLLDYGFYGGDGDHLLGEEIGHRCLHGYVCMECLGLTERDFR